MTTTTSTRQLRLTKAREALARAIAELDAAAAMIDAELEDRVPPIYESCIDTAQRDLRSLVNWVQHLLTH
jgi:hypothetical protein